MYCYIWIFFNVSFYFLKFHMPTMFTWVGKLIPLFAALLKCVPWEGQFLENKDDKIDGIQNCTVSLKLYEPWSAQEYYI